MLKVYGSKLCPDCVALKKAFDAEKVEYEYLDITENLKYMKAFLAIRDRESLYDDAKANGYIGIPTVETEDGKHTLEWQQFVSDSGEETECADGVCGIRH